MANIRRRKFLKQNLALASSLVAGFDAINISRAAHAATLDGYKALVCVYLAGGNDSFNMFIPESASEHADYATARQFLTVPKAQLLPVSPLSYSDGASYGFHPNMPEAHQLFNQGSLALVANVGTLIEPVSKQQYESRSAEIPAQLFSHNDQSDLWMAGDASHRTGLGWAGRMMDMLYSDGRAVPQPSPSISIGGHNLWQTGNLVRSFEMSSGGVASPYLPWHDGPVKLSDAYSSAFRQAQTSVHKMVREHALIQDRAIEYSALVNRALDQAPEFSVPFNGILQKQLEMVAKLIAVREHLDSTINRQIFFVQLGGWDTHSAQTANIGSSHPNLLSQLSSSLGTFNSALTEMGLQNEVTTFSATEFGRSLTPNGSGTDHGWGGHNMVMGGAIRGNEIYGTMPQLSMDSNDAIENNRIIPTTSVDQYSATLAQWFGLDSSEINALFPNLQNFSSNNLGFVT